MSYKKKGRYLIFMLAICLILSGCVNKKTPVEKMYNVLEKVVSKEEVFEEQQDPLVKLEKEEKEKYDQIIGLGMKEYDQIIKLSDEAIALTDKRKEHMDKETESLKKSEQEFRKVADIKDELDNAELKKLINELNEIMTQRYRAHEELYKEYSESLKSDKDLYEMFKNKNLAREDLEAQVSKLNETYKKVLEANENFNKLTEQYNDKKLLFYKKAGLKLNK
ncbi:YkyA family protein [Neobacillus vireti]|uniref:Chromosome partitioning protein n=1 Tax=Neobacillus vireti LMG 21834 TaxID=1131730 RepID=A0AB94IFW1_9BACI|nr:YkyA family protein [Neobacillus vireti]ETI65999.1 chromosome partitioning protein [Neobacillus vireti LMG 21834]